MSRFSVANPKSGHDYSVFITFFFFNLNYPQNVFGYPRLKTTAIEDSELFVIPLNQIGSLWTTVPALFSSFSTTD
jgi:hypothetical protein